MIVKNYPQIAYRWTGFDHVIANFEFDSSIMLGAASKPNRRLTGGSVRFRAVVIV